MTELARQATITEKQFRQQVLDYARFCGWRCYFTWMPIHSPSGFPDLLMLRGERMVIAELKSQEGRLTDAQWEWLEHFRCLPWAEVFLWRPGDWPEIEAVLKLGIPAM